MKSFMQCGFAFFVLIHYMACVWCMVGLVNPCGRDTWLSEYFGSHGHYGTWHIYVAGIHWALATTTSIGYGDVIPSSDNPVEVMTCIVMMIVAAGGWTVVIANAVDLVTDMHQSTEDYERTLDTCQDLFESHPIEEHLRLQITDYFTHFFERKEDQELRDLVNTMSPMLQTAVVKTIYAHWIADVPWIRGMSDGCMISIVSKLQQTIFIPREAVACQRVLRFVELGSVLIAGRFLRKGDSWGIDMMLEGPMRRLEAGFTLCLVSVLALGKRNLELVLDDFPDDAWMVRKVSCFIAFRRKIIQLANAQMAARPEMRRMSSGLASSNKSGMSVSQASQDFMEKLAGKNAYMERLEKNQDHSFAVLTDDTRFLASHIKQKFDVLAENQDDMKSRQKEIVSRLSAIEDQMLKYELVD